MGNWISDNEQLQDLVTNYYQTLYTTSHTNSYKTYTPAIYNVLSQAEATTLSTALIEQDIFKAVQSFQPLKSSGPDGLHPLFYQKFWP